MASSQDSIKESSRLKKEACKNCMEKLKGTLTDDQLNSLKMRFSQLQKSIPLGGRIKSKHKSDNPLGEDGDELDRKSCTLK